MDKEERTTSMEVKHLMYIKIIMHRLFVAFGIAVLLSIASLVNTAYADSDYITAPIVFSNIGSTGGSLTGGPSLRTTVSCNGIYDSGSGTLLIKLSDMSLMGATPYVQDGTGYLCIAVGGQFIYFYPYSTAYYPHMTYSTYIPGNTPTTYSYVLSGTTDDVSRYYQSNAYVPLYEL